MNISITFKDFEPSDHLRKYAERRFQKLGRFLSKVEDAELVIVLSVDKIRHKVDVRFTSSDNNFSAMETSSDMYASVDMVLDKLEVQIKKFNEKRIDKRRRAGKDGEPAVFEVNRYVLSNDQKTQKRILIDENNDEADVLTPEEAADILEEDSQREHIVFLHAEKSTLHVLYRKSNGSFCLIEASER